MMHDSCTHPVSPEYRRVDFYCEMFESCEHLCSDSLCPHGAIRSSPTFTDVLSVSCSSSLSLTCLIVSPDGGFFPNFHVHIHYTSNAIADFNYHLRTCYAAQTTTWFLLCCWLTNAHRGLKGANNARLHFPLLHSPIHFISVNKMCHTMVTQAVMQQFLLCAAVFTYRF